MYDVIIVGGGTAGLSAALVLGRARRRVLVLDGGPPRNAPAHGVNGFFTRDGTPPLQLLQIGREQLAPYTSVEVRQGMAVNAARTEDGFTVELANGSTLQGQTLLLAAGVVDELPPIAGLREVWGRGVYICPYCHGWEVRDQPIAICAPEERLLHYTRTILQWSKNIVVCTNGASLAEATQARLAEWGIAVRTEPITGFEGQDDHLEHVRFADGPDLPRYAMFMPVPQRQRSEIAQQLGCTMTEMFGIPSIKVDDFGKTSVAGVYAAGDARRANQAVTFAAVDGFTAATGINTVLTEIEYGEV